MIIFEALNQLYCIISSSDFENQTNSSVKSENQASMLHTARSVAEIIVNVFIQNLPIEFENEDSLRRFFAPFGNILSIQVNRVAHMAFLEVPGESLIISHQHNARVYALTAQTARLRCEYAH
jgi:hypothetical protein